MAIRRKPAGRVGPLHVGTDGPRWRIVPFPSEKSVRELMVAEIFLRAAANFILYECDISFRPFDGLEQNSEQDLDFSLRTSFGKKALELVEFAPLANFGNDFKNVPFQIEPLSKSELLLDLLRKKSLRQGGANRLLLVYVTEHAFKIDPKTYEIVRRELSRTGCAFERVYYVSVHDEESGTAKELFPGRPMWGFEQRSDHDLKHRGRVWMPHPEEMQWSVTFAFNAEIEGYHAVKVQVTLHQPV